MARRQLTSRTIADGLRTRAASAVRNFATSQAFVDGIITVSEAEIALPCEQSVPQRGSFPSPAGAPRTAGPAFSRRASCPRIAKQWRSISAAMSPPISWPRCLLKLPRNVVAL